MDKEHNPPSADALSGLIQLNAKRLGVQLQWTGKGIDDLITLINDSSNKTLLSKQLWDGMRELWNMPETKALPEPVYAKICSIILAARALTDLALVRRNARAAGQFGPQPTDGGQSA
jgi:hypothetical protein